MPEDLTTPPPRRPAPERLHARIADELADADRRRSRRGAVLAPVAAALVLVAGVAGVAGAGRLGGQRDLVPAQSPTAVPSATTTAGTTPAPTPAPSVSATERPPTVTAEPMTAAQIRRDTARCLTLAPGETDPPPRRGTLRTTYAAVQPLVTTGGRSSTQRVLFLQDDAGLLQCVDGSRYGWQSRSREVVPTAAVPAVQVPNTGGGTSASCGAAADSQVDSDVLLAVDEDAVAAARISQVSDGRVVQTVDVPVSGPFLYAGLRWAGAAARAPMSFRVELHDARGRTLAVQPYGAVGTGPARRLTFPLQSCADAEERAKAYRPEPVTRPSSDRAGLASCRRLVAKSDQTFDTSRARAVVTVSEPDEWGAVLTDGSRYLGCSLFPTREVSASRSVTDSSTAQSRFHWALNPVVPEGESLWAAGHLPGVTAVTYRLPDGTDVPATTGPDGYWMVKARTSTTFDREEDVDDWAPVVVSVVRDGATRRYSIPWTAASMCHQVSHGC